MSTEQSKTPFVRYEYTKWGSTVREKEFVRETAAFLIDARGRKTSKKSSYSEWHESREHVEALIAARLQREADRDFAHRVGDHAKELIDLLDEVTALAELLANRTGKAGGYDITHKARALLQQIREGK